MSDNFLHKYRKPPRQAFAESLYQTISTKDRSDSMFARSAPPLKRIALGLTMLVLIFSLTLAVSPAARAKFLDVMRDVGGMDFIETVDYPGGRGAERLFPEQTMSLDEARRVFPTAVELPDFEPQGFRLKSDEVVVMAAEGYDFSYLRFRLEKGGAWVSVMVEYWHDGSSSRGMIVAPGSVEEVIISGEPAALIRGGWDYDRREWGAEHSLHLRFERKGLIYSLTSVEESFGLDDLISLAESIP
jgi:hypothetical protein